MQSAVSPISTTRPCDQLSIATRMMESKEIITVPDAIDQLPGLATT